MYQGPPHRSFCPFAQTGQQPQASVVNFPEGQHLGICQKKALESITITKLLNNSVGSEPKLGLARLGFGSSFWEKKAWLGLARHAFQKARLGSARHILQKKLGSARLALSFKKPNYLQKQKMS